MDKIETNRSEERIYDRKEGSMDRPELKDLSPLASTECLAIALRADHMIPVTTGAVNEKVHALRRAAFELHIALHRPGIFERE